MDKRITNVSLTTLTRSLADFLLPRECVVCGRPLLTQERHLCVGCLADMPLTYFWAMPHNPMADRFNGLVEADKYVNAAALFCYSGGYESITQALKYRRNFAVGRWAAGQLGRRLHDAGWRVDIVCGVPLHWTRRWRRGYNQADVIGRCVAAQLGAAFAPRLLRRSRRTSAQTRLSGQARTLNVSGAFTACPSTLRWPVKPAMTQGAAIISVLIVDDVFTTGSTLAACYAALRAALGPSVRIAVATLAYVE